MFFVELSLLGRESNGLLWDVSQLYDGKHSLSCFCKTKQEKHDFEMFFREKSDRSTQGNDPRRITLGWRPKHPASNKFLGISPDPLKSEDLPGICHFRYATALFRPVRSRPKCL